MRKNDINAYIFGPDSITTIGLKYLLREYFEIDAITINQPLDNDSFCDSSQMYLIITTSQLFASNLDFFIPRRSRTIILSEENSDDTFIINIHCDESTIINKIEQIIASINIPSESMRQSSLTQREIDVLRLIAKGYINKEIAEKLNISFNTVLSHRKNITTKLGIKSASGLGFYAIMNGYISESDLTNSLA